MGRLAHQKNQIKKNQIMRLKNLMIIYMKHFCFSQNKKQIILDLDQFNRNGDKKITNLIMNSLDGVDLYKGEKEKKRADGDLSNLFCKEIFLTFKNVKSVIIIT